MEETLYFIQFWRPESKPLIIHALGGVYNYDDARDVVNSLRADGVVVRVYELFTTDRFEEELKEKP